MFKHSYEHFMKKKVTLNVLSIIRYKFSLIDKTFRDLKSSNAEK